MSSSRVQRVVVGVDETHASRAALAFAIRVASLRGSTVEVITAWTLTGENPSATHDEDHRVEAPEQARRLAQQIQDRAVALTLQEVHERPLLSRQVLQGDAGQVLLRAARDADYLVVGTTTNDEPMRPASLGPVSDYCIRNAPCAVVVVQAPARKTKPQDAEGGHDANKQRTTSGSLS